jgi:hypothetical protein
MVTADSEEDAIARAEQDLNTMSSHDWGEGTVAFSERSSYLVRHEAPNPARSMFVDA